MTRAPTHAPTRSLDEIQFMEPPARRRHDWAAIAAKLRERPMEWALIWEQGLTSTVNAIRQGKVRDLHPDRGFEAMTFNNTRTSPRTCDFYLRYNPDHDLNGEPFA